MAGNEQDSLARIRENQRRSRARRKEYLQELENRLRNWELQGVKASSEVQIAARKVIEENKKLRGLLVQQGINDTVINDYLAGSDTPESTCSTQNQPTGSSSPGGIGLAAHTLNQMLSSKFSCISQDTSWLLETSSSSAAPNVSLQPRKSSQSTVSRQRSSRPSSFSQPNLRDLAHDDLSILQHGQSRNMQNASIGMNSNFETMIPDIFDMDVDYSLLHDSVFNQSHIQSGYSDLSEATSNISPSPPANISTASSTVGLDMFAGSVLGGFSSDPLDHLTQVHGYPGMGCDSSSSLLFPPRGSRRSSGL